MRTLRRVGGLSAFVLFLALLTCAFVLEGSQPSHTHTNGRLGLYNTECPLAQLAAVHSEGWAPEPLAIVSPAEVALPSAVTPSGWTPSLSPSRTDSRAPPLA